MRAELEETHNAPRNRLITGSLGGAAFAWLHARTESERRLPEERLVDVDCPFRETT
jgi:hypothetical protein